MFTKAKVILAAATSVLTIAGSLTPATADTNNSEKAPVAASSDVHKMLSSVILVELGAFESLIGSSGSSSELFANIPFLRPMVGSSLSHTKTVAPATSHLIHEEQAQVAQYAVMNDTTIRALVSIGACQEVRPYVEKDPNSVRFAVIAGREPGADGPCVLSLKTVALDISVPEGIGDRLVSEATVPQSELH